MTMTTHEQVRSTVFRVLDELNEQRAPHEQLPKDDSVPLVGLDGYLDSLGLVNLIALLEEKVEQEFGMSLNLIDGLGDGSGFASVGELVTLVGGLLADRTHV